MNFSFCVRTYVDIFTKSSKIACPWQLFGRYRWSFLRRLFLTTTREVHVRYGAFAVTVRLARRLIVVDGCTIEFSVCCSCLTYMATQCVVPHDAACRCRLSCHCSSARCVLCTETYCATMIGYVKRLDMLFGIVIHVVDGWIAHRWKHNRRCAWSW